MYPIKKITSQETFPVRQPVLRPGKPVESCIFEGDDLPTTAHFGIYDENTIIGCLSVFKYPNAFFASQDAFQIRGMAVLPSHQKKGLGEKLMEAAEDYIKQQNGRTIWFNAREIAVGFYKKLGYAIEGEPFDILDIGPHYVMFKEIKN
jgi:ribosomal protein S18 acetylase RimI-like enzyme